MVDKPAGPTSHQVSAWVKQILRTDRGGHGGTLDPAVTGVLPVAVNNSLRVIQVLLLGPKEYVGIIHFHRDITQREVEMAFKEFTGEIYQTPPLRSAVKRTLRTRKIYSLKLLEFDGRNALFRVLCESGTYIRTLCTDIGDAMGVGAHMEALRRTRTANITEEHAVKLHDLKDAYEIWQETGEDSFLREAVKPVELMVSHLPGVVVKDSAVDAICHGAPLAAPGLYDVTKDYNAGDTIVFYTKKGEAIAIGKAEIPSIKAIKRKDGIIATTDRLIMDPGTYPPGWKKH